MQCTKFLEAYCMFGFSTILRNNLLVTYFMQHRGDYYLGEYGLLRLRYGEEVQGVRQGRKWRTDEG